MNTALVHRECPMYVLYTPGEPPLARKYIFERSGSGCVGWLDYSWLQDSSLCRPGGLQLATWLSSLDSLLCWTIPRQGGHNAATEIPAAMLEEASQLPAIPQFWPPCSRVTGLCHQSRCTLSKNLFLSLWRKWWAIGPSVDTFTTVSHPLPSPFNICGLLYSVSDWFLFGKIGWWVAWAPIVAPLVKVLKK